MHTSLILLLQLTASLLMNAKTLSPEQQMRAIADASRVIQTATKTASGVQDKTGGSMADAWPSYSQLLRSQYLTERGTWVSLGSEIQIVPESISFGDLNYDALDDAVVIVRRGTSHAFAVMLNQGGGNLFNISDLSLAQGYSLSSHHVEGGQLNVELSFPGKEKKMYHYKLIGSQLIEL